MCLRASFKFMGVCACFSFKKIPSSRMAASDGPWRISYAAQRSLRGRVLPCTSQWPHSLQRPQQSQSWRCSQGSISVLQNHVSYQARNTMPHDFLHIILVRSRPILVNLRCFIFLFLAQNKKHGCFIFFLYLTIWFPFLYMCLNEFQNVAWQEEVLNIFTTHVTLI